MTISPDEAVFIARLASRQIEPIYPFQTFNPLQDLQINLEINPESSL